MALRDIESIEAFNNPETDRLVRAYANNVAQPPFAGIGGWMMQAAEVNGYSPEYAQGIGNYILRRSPGGRMSRYDAATTGLRALDAFTGITDEPPAKARSFNYLPINPRDSIELQLTRALQNAEFLSGRIGSDFFSGRSFDDRYYRAEVGHGFAVALKSGSGSGTFSMDLAIEADRYKDDRDKISPAHELWRVGVDTSDFTDLDTGEYHTTGRIIRTGSGVKPTDTQKSEDFEQFVKRFRTTPQRILTFLAAQLIHSMDFDHGLALSTYGALNLSTLKKSKSGTRTRYSEIHESAGFVDALNPYWHHAEGIHDGFYDTFVSHSRNDPGMKKHEDHTVHKAIMAFNDMTNYPAGEKFPVRLCHDDTQELVECALKAFMNRYRHH